MISLQRWGKELENPSAFLRLDGELAAASRNLPVECRGPLNLSAGGTVSVDVCVFVWSERKISISSHRRTAFEGMHHKLTV